jgi:hypothetical protein
VIGATGATGLSAAEVYNNPTGTGFKLVCSVATVFLDSVCAVDNGKLFKLKDHLTDGSGIDFLC